MTSFLSLRSALSAAACIAVSGLLTPAFGGSDEDARKHFEAGESYFKTSDYDGALREFQMAWKLSNRPLILLNIANVYERMAKLPETVAALKEYLERDPKTAQRATIELRIQNLQRRIDQMPMSAEGQDAGPSAQAVQSPSASAPAPTAPAAVTAVPVAPPVPPSRTPAYISWGIGGAAAIGAIVTGVIANGKYSDAESGCARTPLGCSDGEVDPIKNLALVSTILTGVAVVGAGLGTYFYLSAKPTSQEAATGVVPRVAGGIVPGRGGVNAVWSF